MKIDTTDYYPVTPGSSCDPDYVEESVEARGPVVKAECESDAGDEIELPSAGDKDADPWQWMTVISHVLSWVLSPLLTPTYGILVVFGVTALRYAPSSSIWTVSLIVFGLTAVLPGFAVWLLTRFGDVSDMALSRRSDRLYPYIIMGAALAGTGFYLQVIGMPLWIDKFFWGGAIACAVNLAVNTKWKISAHGAGMGGFVAMLSVLGNDTLPHPSLWIWVIVAVMLTGFLGSARVWLGRHTAAQTVAGSLVGFLSVFLLELF